MALSYAELRALMPAAAAGGYLNAAAASPLPRPVEEVVRRHHREIMERGDACFGAWLSQKEAVRARLGAMLGTAADHVAFVPSTSSGLGAVASILRQRGVEEVVTLEGEFPSSTLPFLNEGLRLRVVSPRPDGTFDPAHVEAACTKATGALVASAVQYASGVRLDLDAASSLCRSRGMLFVLNAAQALGQLALSVSSPHVDVLCATSHKWMMAGFGGGVCVARPGLFEGVRPPWASWTSVADPMAMDGLLGADVSPEERLGDARVRTARGAGAFRADVRVLESGATALSPVLALGAAAELLERVSLKRIQAYNAALQTQLRRRLREAGYVPNAPDEPGLVAGICVFPVQGAPSAVAEALARHDVTVSPRGVGLRVSTHVFNDEEDIDRLLWALAAANVRPG